MAAFVHGASLPLAGAAAAAAAARGRALRGGACCGARALTAGVANAADAKPLNDRLLVRVSTADRVTSGGLLLAGDAAEKRPRTGVVLAVPDTAADTETEVARFSVGDNVMWTSDFVAEVVQGEPDRIVSVRARCVNATW
jgi:co-chaperonin GroES (HSP10)